MRILTLNTWQERGPWRERWEVTFRGMECFRPEIAAFQELFNPAWAQEVRKRTGYASLLFPEEPCGLAILTDFPVQSWGVAKLTKSPLEDYLRCALWAELRVRGERIVIINTHLPWMLEDGSSRRKQVEEILELVKKKAPQAGSILMGDLNAPPDSSEIQWLIDRGPFRDLFRERHPNQSGFSWDNRNPYAGGSFHKMPDRRIDYILVRGKAPFLQNLVSCDLVYTEPDANGVWASDHYGLLAEFQ